MTIKPFKNNKEKIAFDKELRDMLTQPSIDYEQMKKHEWFKDINW